MNSLEVKTKSQVYEIISTHQFSKIFVAKYKVPQDIKTLRNTQTIFVLLWISSFLAIPLQTNVRELHLNF